MPQRMLLTVKRLGSTNISLRKLGRGLRRRSRRSRIGGHASTPRRRRPRLSDIGEVESRAWPWGSHARREGVSCYQIGDARAARLLAGSFDGDAGAAAEAVAAQCGVAAFDHLEAGHRVARE